MTRGTALAAVLALGAAVVAFASPASAVTPPTDPNQKGYIGLCDRSGHQITTGSIDAAPFVWKAVAASFTPPAQYVGQGQNVVLNIYQPRPETDPADWSGDQLTAPSLYVSQPAAIATIKDESLATFMKAYPAEVDGLYELRMFFAANASPTYTVTYPALFIRVSGHTWTAVGGGKVDCAAKAQSFEVFNGVVPAKDSGGTNVGKAAEAPRVTPLPKSTKSGATSGSAPSASTSDAGKNGAAAHSGKGGSSVGLIIGIVAAAVVAAGAAAWFWLRRRTPA